MYSVVKIQDVGISKKSAGKFLKEILHDIKD